MPSARLFAVTIDCPDPTHLAQFYKELLGGELLSSNNDFVVLTSDRGVRVIEDLIKAPAVVPGSDEAG
ncbi:MAG TPA: VOC family protein [Streptosporangiaceae bacterium]|nr:VOC family protein [Streptosporangiaceae bacterium]